MTSTKEEIRKEAARALEAATYASKTQFEYSKRWCRVDRWSAAWPRLWQR